MWVLAALLFVGWVGLGLAEPVIHSTLHLRHHILRRFARNGSHREQSCPTDKYVIITEYQFGRTGNNIIELTHGLWLSEKLHATLLVPGWMMDVFTPFETDVLKSQFCYTTNEKDIAKSAKRYEVTSEDSFFAFKLFKDPLYRPLLPEMNNSTMHDLSLHFLKVYASLWCCPQRKILQSVEFIVLNYLGGSFDYAAVHKRQLEGGCSKILAANTKISDFSPFQLPMTHPEWSGSLAHSHPLCEMTYSFVRATLDLNHHNNTKLFVAYDGRGGIQDYLQQGSSCVFSSVLDTDSQYAQLPYDRKFVDMLMAIHSDFFILNPRSTFSWQIYLIRLILALPSVPLVKNNDFYMQKVPEELAANQRDLWVSWASTMNALMESPH